MMCFPVPSWLFLFTLFYLLLTPLSHEAPKNLPKKGSLLKDEQVVLDISPLSLRVALNEISFIGLRPLSALKHTATISLSIEPKSLLTTSVATVSLPAGNPVAGEKFVTIHAGSEAGQVYITFHTESEEVRIDSTRQYVQVQIVVSEVLYVLTFLCGWAYFFIWSISYYPQIWTNYSRKKVSGFSLDYLAYNSLGHTSYLIFNIAMYYSAKVQRQYLALHPRSIIPVRANDVVFSIHSVAMCYLTAYQCFIYDRGGQRLSKICCLFIVTALTSICGGLYLVTVGNLIWIKFLYLFSFIKLVVTLIKYLPQIKLNWESRSTIGYNIYCAQLDGFGGIWSVLQMIFASVNNSSWEELLGNPTKLWLGLFSVFFNIILNYQHYVAFRSSWRPRKITTSSSSDSFQNSLKSSEKPSYSVL